MPNEHHQYMVDLANGRADMFAQRAAAVNIIGDHNPNSAEHFRALADHHQGLADHWSQQAGIQKYGQRRTLKNL
jgi:hypothetical protein